MDETLALELEGASYWRGERVILNKIDWRIRRGEHWALLGANGSGKTTLLRMVSAVDWPCDGTIRVLGRRFGEVDLRELRRAIGIVTSTLASYFHDRQSALQIVETGSTPSWAGGGRSGPTTKRAPARRSTPWTCWRSRRVPTSSFRRASARRS